PTRAPKPKPAMNHMKPLPSLSDIQPSWGKLETGMVAQEPVASGWWLVASKVFRLQTAVFSLQSSVNLLSSVHSSGFLGGAKEDFAGEGLRGLRDQHGYYV